MVRDVDYGGFYAYVGQGIFENRTFHLIFCEPKTALKRLGLN